MNAFMKTLPQYRIRSHLKNAFDRIIASYSGVLSSHTAHNVPDNNTNLNIENGPTRPVTQATQPSQELEVTLRPPESDSLPSVTSTRSTRSEVALDDTQPAGFFSSVERGPQAWPIYQSLPEPETTQVPSPKATDHSISANPENNSEFPPSVRSPDMLFGPTQRALRPEALLGSLEQTGPREEPAEFTQMTPQQEDSTYELAWPLASWELASYDIQLDWGAGLPENTLQNCTENNLVSSMSNPFPPCDSLEPLASLEWDLFRSANGLSFGENSVLH
ncbi:hypothetical protein N7478_001424 [Penicillium angulare]|uniref:uncharacterized protein n=1 Tax=Penicillium angulare TaxID=116970 RepID=UPI0025404000|nr:uncharacterized protein N7478_001424 [Penicillium angulare]KAJ5292173.1 hypothetical protein N7478_001424 [Penicillium angulare]